MPVRRNVEKAVLSLNLKFFAQTVIRGRWRMADVPSSPASLPTRLVTPAALDGLVPGLKTWWLVGEDAG